MQGLGKLISHDRFNSLPGGKNHAASGPLPWNAVRGGRAGTGPNPSGAVPNETWNTNPGRSLFSFPLRNT